MDNKAYMNGSGDETGMSAVATNNRLARSMSEEMDPETAARREEARTKAPVKYCQMITDRPKTWFFITLGAGVLMLVITFIMLAVGYDIIPIVFENLPLDINDNKYHLRGYAWLYRDEADDIYERDGEDSIVQPERSRLKEEIFFIYQKKGSNVLTQKRLRAMQKNEEKFYSMKKFQNKVCFLLDDECVKARSITQFFDGTYGDLDPIFNDPGFDNITGVLNRAFDTAELRRSLDFFLPTKHTIEPENVYSSIVRSALPVGFPLKGYRTDEDDEDDQITDLQEFYQNEFIAEGQEAFEDGVGGMDFYYYSFNLFQVFIINQAYLDMALLGGSLGFIFLFMWFQTRSLFITGFAQFAVLTTFCTANMIYRVVFDFRYFGIFHILALFIILGIGADNVFVLYDTWRESGHYKFPTVAHRLSWAYRRGAMAMMWTSLTTALAFVVSATSPFLGVSTFGVFAGLLVAVNYFSIIIHLPTVIIVYHIYFEKFCCCCCGTNQTAPSEDSVTPNSDKKNIIVRFFGIYYFKFITHRIIKWVIMGFFALLLAGSIFMATKLEVNEEQLQFLPEDTNFGGVTTLLQDEFSQGDEPLRVFIVWGLKEQNLDDCHHSDPECEGDTKLDKSFDISTAEQQLALLNFCDKMGNLTDGQIKDLNIKKDPVTNMPEVYCFPKLMQEFMVVEAMREVVAENDNETMVRRYPNDTVLSYPVDQDTAEAMMEHIDYVYNGNLLPDNPQSRWFEIGMDTWLQNGFPKGEVQDFTYTTYQKFLGVSDDTGYTEKSTAFEDDVLPYPYLYGTRIRYAAIVVNTTIKPRSLGFIDGQPIRKDWEDFVAGEMKHMPEGLRNGFQVTPIDYEDFNLWHWLDVQEVMVSSAMTGIGIGLGCALPILIVATMNIVVGIMATLNIALITVTVIGFIPLMGWKLSLMESLNLVLVVGLSVDYCVHLAEGYCRSSHHDRKGRLHDALQEVGISVVSGCITTLGASSLMLFAVITFFTQFGTFLFATLAFALLYSLGFFCTALGIMGPQNQFGDLHVLWRKLKACCCRKQASGDITPPRKYSENQV